MLICSRECGWPSPRPSLFLGGRRRRSHEADCREKPGVTVWSSPENPVAGEPLRILVVAESGAGGGRRPHGAGGTSRPPVATTRRGGPPFSFSAEGGGAAPRASTASSGAPGREGAGLQDSFRGRQERGKQKPARAHGTAVWGEHAAAGIAPPRASTRPGSSAVRRARRPVAGLPAAAPGAARSGAQLPLRPPRPARGRSEEQGGAHGRRPTAPTCRISCARTSRGSWGCRSASATAIAATQSRAAALRDVLQQRGRAERQGHAGGWCEQLLPPAGQHACSRAARAPALADDATDYYPVPLDREALRPGVIYADPYGHVMVVVKWVHADGGKGGLLLAVDGQPDNVDRAQALLGGDVPVRQRGQERGPGLQGVPPASRAARRRQAGAAGQRGARRQGRPLRTAVLRRAGEALARRLLRAHGQAHQPGGARRREGVRETLDALVEQLDDARRLGGQRREVHAREAGSQVVADARGPEDLRDHRPVGGLRDAVARHAPADRDERAARRCPSGSSSTPSCSCLGGRKPEERARRDRDAARQR